MPFALGDPELDDDHAALSRLIDAFFSSSVAAAAGTLDALRVEARAHFAREDVDLRRLGGNNASCHLDEHAAVLASLDEVHALLLDRNTSPDAAQRLVVSLSLELQRWLPEHVREMDAELAAVRSRSRWGGAVVRLQRADRAPA